MQNQRIRNLTTGRLHTEMEHIYQDVEFITGQAGVMTHQLPNAFKAMQPWLRSKITDPRFWDGAWDSSHEGETTLEPMTKDEQKEFFAAYAKLPSLLSLIGTNSK